jgi:hypothetical protein
MSMPILNRGLKRKTKETVNKNRNNGLNVGPAAPLSTSELGEVYISSNDLDKLHALYTTSPSIQACRSILVGQLLGSGIVIRRDGKDISLKPTFQQHIEQHWLPFARDLIDSFLTFGFAVVALDEQLPEKFARLRNLDVGAKKPTNYIPLVVDHALYTLSYERVGEFGYQRNYRVQITKNSKYVVDSTCEVFCRTPPDAYGNPISPTSTVYQSASFVSALEDLALQAEVVRSRQVLVTQSATKHLNAQGIDPQSLFFDSESRHNNQQSNVEDDADAANALAIQSKLMTVINRMQTTDGNGSSESTHRRSVAGGSTSVPPPLPPYLFSTPEKQSVVSGIRPPECRNDLTEIIRVMNDHVGASFGCPASIIFEGKYSSNSMSQCAAAFQQSIIDSTNPNPRTTLNAALGVGWLVAGCNCSTQRCSPWRSPSTRS